MIEELCKIRNTKKDPLVRFRYIKSVLDSLKIEYIIDEIILDKPVGSREKFYNIYVFGSSSKYLCAHHDVIYLKSDNANDNSASIVNMIEYRLKNPSVNLIITDGEEPPYFGIGADAASKYLKGNNISVEWVLNLELTGKGKYFFIDTAKTKLSSKIIKEFDEEEYFVIETPFNDSVIFRSHGFDSNVITTVDKDKHGELDMSILYYSHSPKDSIKTISNKDMKYFRENVLDRIVK